MTIERRHVGKRLSEMVIHHTSGLVFLAGQVADDGHATINVQAQQVLASIDRLLAEAGSSKRKIVSATIYLPDMTDFPAFNSVWEAWAPPGETPARATVQAKLASPDYRIEISVIASL
jgi:enamine deaminase RidA (YjgF/YER057c/UK114 family)